MYLVFQPLGLGLDKFLFDWNSVKLDPIDISKLKDIVAHEDFQATDDGARVMAIRTLTEVSCNCCDGVVHQDVSVHGLGIAGEEGDV